MQRTARVLVNPHAGGVSATDPDQLTRQLEEGGVTAEIENVDPSDLAERVVAWPDRSLIAVAGGDGSHRTAAGALLGSTTALAPVPTGRLNHFARRAGMETVDRAARAIRDGDYTTIPVGSVGGQVFLDTAVVGAHTEFIRLREKLRPVLTNWPAAALASLLVLARWPRVELTIRTPDQSFPVRTAMLWVGAGRNSFPAPHEAPLPSPGDPLQVVILTGGRTAVAPLAGSLLRYHLRGRRFTDSRRMTVLEVPWIELDSPGPIPLALDGEPRLLEPPVRVDLGDRTLRVVVPRS